MVGLFKKKGIKVVFITRLCFIYPRQRGNCKNPILATGEAAGKSQLCNAAEKKSKDRGGRDTTQDGRNVLKHAFLSFLTHLMLGSLELLPMLSYFPRDSAQAVSLLQVGLGEVVCAKQIPLSVVASWP